MRRLVPTNYGMPNVPKKTLWSRQSEQNGDALPVERRVSPHSKTAYQHFQLLASALLMPAK